MRKRAFAWLLLLVGLSVLVAGCGDTVEVASGDSEGSTDEATVGDPPTPRLLLIGTVVTSTGAPVAGARVTACPIDAQDITDGSGAFRLEVYERVASWVELHFERAALATRVLTVFVDSTGQSDESVRRVVVEDDDPDAPWSFVTMREGYTLDVLLTVEGDPIGAGADLAALLEDHFVPLEPGPIASACAQTLRGTTDADGVVQLTNLDPAETYRIVVPGQELFTSGFAHDRRATETRMVLHRIDEEGDVLAIDLRPASVETPVLVEGTDLCALDTERVLPTGPIQDAFGYGQSEVGTRILINDTDETVAFTHANISADGSVTVLFRTPVTIVSDGAPLEPHFELRNNLVEAGTADYDTDTQRTTIAATVTDVLPTAATAGVLFRFTPDSELPENEVFELRFLARSLQGEDAKNISIPFYRSPIGGIDAPSLDNYDGLTEVPFFEFIEGVPTALTYLEFDRVVDGVYKVLELQIGDAVYTPTEPTLEDIALLDSAIVANVDAVPSSNVAELAAATGTRYRVPLVSGSAFQAGPGAVLPPPGPGHLGLPNDAPDAAVTVTLVLSVRDWGGNRLDTTITLPVR